MEENKDLLTENRILTDRVQALEKMIKNYRDYIYILETEKGYLLKELGGKNEPKC